jgi:hypothetical protein
MNGYEKMKMAIRNKDLNFTALRLPWSSS